MPLSRRQLQRLVSMERLKSFARSMAWVAPLTVLIWVYAEREQIATVPEVPVSLTAHSASPDRVASFVRATDRNVLVELEGPRVRLDAVRQSLSTGPLALDLDANVPSGTVTRSTVELLNRLALFKDNGVKVVSSTTPELSFQIDPLVTREVPVMADPMSGLFESAPVFDPPTVRLTGPAALIERLLANDPTGRIVIRPDILRSPELKAPGPHDMPEVLLLKPVSPNTPDATAAMLTLSPDRVRATFRIRQAEVSYTIPAMPVFVIAPGPLLDDYRPVHPPVVTNVTVQGSPEVIAALKADALPRKPKALLELGRDDLPPGRTLSRRLRFDLPDGVSISAEDQAREIEFTLSARTKGE